MAIISNKPSMAFKMPLSNVEIAASFELIPSESLYTITPAGTVSGSAYLKSLPAGSVDLVIPSVINGITVTGIGNNAFKDYISLKTVSIPDSVTNAGMNLFYGCTSLTSVNLGNGITSIVYLVFYNCTSLSLVMIGTGLTFIEASAFNGCTSLRSINVNANNTKFRSLGGILFSKDASTLVKYAGIIGEYTTPINILTIGEGAFSHSSLLTSVTLSARVQIIKSSAFNYCKELTTVTIPNSVTSIDINAFRACPKLTSINIDKPVNSITGAPWDAPVANAVKWLR